MDFRVDLGLTTCGSAWVEGGFGVEDLVLRVHLVVSFFFEGVELRVPVTWLFVGACSITAIVSYISNISQYQIELSSWACIVRKEASESFPLLLPAVVGMRPSPLFESLSV